MNVNLQWSVGFGEVVRSEQAETRLKSSAECLSAAFVQSLVCGTMENCNVINNDESRGRCRHDTFY